MRVVRVSAARSASVLATRRCSRRVFASSRVAATAAYAAALAEAATSAEATGGGGGSASGAPSCGRCCCDRRTACISCRSRVISAADDEVRRVLVELSALCLHRRLGVVAFRFERHHRARRRVGARALGGASRRSSAATSSVSTAHTARTVHRSKLRLRRALLRALRGDALR